MNTQVQQTGAKAPKDKRHWYTAALARVGIDARKLSNNSLKRAMSRLGVSKHAGSREAKRFHHRPGRSARHLRYGRGL